MHQTRVMPWARTSRVGGVQPAGQECCWLNWLFPSRLDGFLCGATMDLSPLLPPSITWPWGGRVIPQLEQTRAVLLPALRVAQGFPGCWRVTLPLSLIIPAAGRGFFWMISSKVVVWSHMTGIQPALLWVITRIGPKAS